MRIWEQSDIYDLIKKYPEQLEQGFRMAEFVRLPKGIDQVVIVALSYNATIAEIAKNLFEMEASVPIRTHIGYGLPTGITPITLVVAISLCGERPEILSAAKAAYTAKAKLVVVTAGGELEVFAREHNSPLVLIDKNLPELKEPVNRKLSGGIMLAVIIQILINAGVLPPEIRQNILTAIGEIESMYLPKLGEKVANLIADNHILIYSSNRYTGLATLLKALLNILVTLPGATNTIAAALGSDIYGFSHKGWAKHFILILEDTTESELEQKSLLKLEEKITHAKLAYSTLELPGSNQLTKTLAGIMLFYWAIHALLNKEK